MWWLQDIVVPLLLAAGACCFVVMVRFRTRLETRRTTRSVESMYPLYADSARKQRKYARERGGQWQDNEDADRLRRQHSDRVRVEGRASQVKR